MSRKYTAGRVVDVFDIRNELYDLRNMVIGWKNDHLSDVMKEGKGKDHSVILRSPEAGDKAFACLICHGYDYRIAGINQAIRRFGGSPR